MTAATTAVGNTELRLLVAKRIRRNPGIDPRISRNATKYNSIKESIAQHGVQQAILVRPVSGDAEHDFEVVAGNTRHAATLEIGVELIPAMIRQMTDAEARVAAAIENMQRADLTPVEEAKHAQIVLADMGNDHEAVCKALDWSRTKLNSRILLSHCNEDVAEALVQDRIKIGHAELLAGVAQDKQSSILEKIIERGMSVIEARDRLFALSRDLTKAKFDTADCQNCPNNSATSRDLFDTSLEGSMCQNASCWDTKAAALIEVKLIEAQNEFGVVHTDLTLPAGAYVALQAQGADGVGSEQISACVGCANYGATVSTVIGNEGAITGGLCFNKECNAEKKAAYKEKLAAVAAASKAETAPQEKTSGAASSQAAPAAQAPKGASAEKPDAGKAQAAVMRKGMRRQAFTLYSAMGMQAVKQTPTLGLAIAIVSLYFDLRKDVPDELVKRFDTQLGVKNHLTAENRSQIEVELAKRSVDDLTLLLHKMASCTVYRRDLSDQFEKSVSGSQSLAFIEFADLNPKGFFKMTADYLKTLVKAGVVEELKRSGFEAKYKAEKGDKAFTQLCGMKSDELITAVMAFTEFDWTGYVPAALEISAQKSGGTTNLA